MLVCVGVEYVCVFRLVIVGVCGCGVCVFRLVGVGACLG